MSPNPNVRDIVLDNYLTLERMPAEVQYSWLMKKIPRRRNTFIRYIR